MISPTQSDLSKLSVLNDVVIEYYSLQVLDKKQVSQEKTLIWQEDYSKNRQDLTPVFLKLHQKLLDYIYNVSCEGRVPDIHKRWLSSWN